MTRARQPTLLEFGEEHPPVESRPWLDEAGLVRWLWAVAALTTAWKLLLLLLGNAIWEESHFAVLGSHPDLSYADVPAGWPLLGRAAMELLGPSLPALRLPALLIAQAIPFAVYFLARGLVLRREALWAALAAFFLPAIGTNGTIFYPESGMQLFFALMLGCAVRAVRSDRLVWWLGTGAFAALGLLTHHRFAVAGLGVLAFALFSGPGRALWSRPGFWLAGVLAAASLAPSLVYNMREGWPALGYHVVNRPQWALTPASLLNVLAQQVAYATPVFFAGCALGLWSRRRTTLPEEQMVLWTGGAVFVLFAALSLFNPVVNAHWLFLTYLALLPFAPAALAGFVDRAATAASRRRRVWGVAALGPGLAVVGALGVTAFQLAWAEPERVPPGLRGFLISDLEDWTRVQAPLRRAEAQARERFGGAPLVATVGHLDALRLEFPGWSQRELYAVTTTADRFTRFEVMRRRWRLDEVALFDQRPGAPVVAALAEPSYLYHTPDEVRIRRALCERLEQVQLEARVELPPGRVNVQLFTGRLSARPQPVRPDCPLLPPTYLAQPIAGEVLPAGEPKHGYGAAAHPNGIRRVELVVDGQVATTARHGLDPAGARSPDVLAYDPAYPRVQFDFSLPAASMTRGAHRVWARAHAGDGSVQETPPRVLYVR